MHRFLTQADAEKLDPAVREILKRAGYRIRHECCLRSLEQAGCRIDWNKQRAFMTDEVIEAAVQRRMEIGVAEPPGWSAAGQWRGAVGFEIAPLIYEWPEGSVRQATESDLVAMIKAAHAHPLVRSVAAPFAMSDHDPLLEPLESFALIARLTDKPISAVSLVPHHNDYFAELGLIVAGDSARYIGCGGWLSSPLILSGRIVELMRLAPRYGVNSAHAGTMAIAGISAPITRAGAVAMLAAEILGAWVAAMAVNPDVSELRGGSCSGILDPRTGKSCFGAPEAIKQDIMVCELFDMRFGGGVSVAGIGYCDAKVPGIQAAAEKMLKALAVAYHRGTTPRLGSPGLLDAGRVFCPVQWLIDLELDQALFHFARREGISDDAIGLDAVVEAVEEAGSFIGLEHTARHFREAVWMPELLDRSAQAPQPGSGAELKMLQRAHQKLQELISSYSPPARPAEQIEAIERVVEAARRELPKSGAHAFLA